MLLRISFSGRVVAAFIGSAAFTGIIGNRADDWFVDTIPDFISQPVPINVGWMVFILLWTFCLPMALALKFRESLKNVSNLVEVGDVFARNILSLYEPIDGRPDAETEAKRFSLALFQKIVESSPFSDCGIAIYYPDNESGYLRLWQHHGNPNESDYTLAFSIRENNNPNAIRQPKGIPGKTFTSKKTLVVHFNKQGIADDNDYFSGRSNAPPYRSTICTAILDSLELNSVDSEPIGVLCLYSDSENTFDNRGIVTIVESLATRFSVVLQSFSQC